MACRKADSDSMTISTPSVAHVNTKKAAQRAGGGAEKRSSDAASRARAAAEPAEGCIALRNTLLHGGRANKLSVLRRVAVGGTHHAGGRTRRDTRVHLSAFSGLTDEDGDGGAAAPDGAHQQAVVKHRRQLHREVMLQAY